MAAIISVQKVESSLGDKETFQLNKNLTKIAPRGEPAFPGERYVFDLTLIGSCSAQFRVKSAPWIKMRSNAIV